MAPMVRSTPRVVAATPVARSSYGGQAFLQELESRMARPVEETPVPRDVYYDYPGDVHEVEDVEGIGGVYGEKLRAVGVKTTARLCYEDPAALAQKLGVARKTIEQWQSMSELMKIKGVGPQYAEAMARAGVEGIEELKRRSAETIATDVNAYLDTLKTNVLGQKVTAKRIEGWQKAAKPLRRVRQQVPTE
jgi:predicted flap endonuclease-1-like 5' DNA nuclease